MNEATENVIDDSCDQIHEGFRQSIIDYIDEEFERTLLMCRKTTIEALRLSGLIADEILDEQINIILEWDRVRLLGQLGVAYLSFLITVDGYQWDKYIKCAIKVDNWRVLGAFLAGYDQDKTTQYFAYDDWTNPTNPVLVCTGSDNGEEVDLLTTAVVQWTEVSRRFHVKCNRLLFF